MRPAHLIQEIPRQRRAANVLQTLPPEASTPISRAKDIANLLHSSRILSQEITILAAPGKVFRGQVENVDMATYRTANIAIERRMIPDEQSVPFQGEISFELFREHYRFWATLSSKDEDCLEFSLPETIFRIHQRQLDRVVLNSNESLPAIIQEATGHRTILGRIVDLSANGLGFEISEGKNIDRDRILGLDQDCVVRVQGVPEMEQMAIPASVCRWAHKRQQKVIHLGLASRIPLSYGDALSLEDLLLRKKYPNVARARTHEDFSEVWRLLNLSFKTIDATPDQTRRTTSILTWKKASWSPRPINSLYLLSRSSGGNPTDRSIGTIAASRYYSRTWLIHQLGVDGTKGQLLSHQLYGRVVDYLRNTAEVDYLVGTFPKESHVFQRYYVDFIKNDSTPQYHYLEETNILEFDTRKAHHDLKERSKKEREIAVSMVDQRSHREILQHLRTRYPASFLKALNLQDYDMWLDEVSTIYDRVALRRGREIWQVRTSAENRLLGYVIVEWGSDDQNVFSLFDNFRLIIVDDRSPQLENIKTVLLKKAFEILLKNGVRNAISWTRDQSLLNLVPSGKVFYEVYYWIAHANRMKPFLRHLDRFHGSTAVARQARRKPKPN